MTSQPLPGLQCAVIGAGIAGLSASIALRRAGHDVELFEKSSFRNEIGAALTITPNGTNVLDRWGFDYNKARTTAKRQNRRVDPHTMDIVAHGSFRDVPKLYGHSFDAFHRVDIHSILREMTQSEDLPASVSFRLGTAVKAIDCEEGIVFLEDDTQHKKDLIIVADGIKSRFVKDVNGTEVPREFTGSSVHRTLLDFDNQVMKNDILKPFFENEESGFFNTVNPKNGVMWVTYPCRDDKTLNVAVFHRSRPSEQAGDDWNAPADIDDVLSLLDEFHPFWPALAKCAGPDDWKCFPVSKRDPLDRVVNGKAVIIGDAAHGVSMALEDAAALEILLQSSRPGDDLSRRLALYQQLRLPRFAVVQLMSNSMMYHRDGDGALHRIRQYYQGDIPIKAESWSRPITDFLYGYDIFDQAAVALQYMQNDGRVPEGVLKYFGDAHSGTTL